MVCLVTAYLDLHESRPIDKRVETHLQNFQNLASLGLPMHVFISRCFLDMFIKAIPNQAHIYLEVIELEELATYKELEGAEIDLPQVRNAPHDTRNFMILMNSKAEFVQRAIQKNAHAATHFAWIDFGICHVFRDPVATCEFLKVLHNGKLKDTLLAFPGSWEKGAGSETLFAAVNWRFSGGFFIGDAASLTTWHEMHRQHFRECMVQKNTLVWETNFWAWCELQGHWTPNWYKADHNDSIIKIPASMFSEPPIVHRRREVIVRVPEGVVSYWDGPLSRCYVRRDIENYVQESVRKQDLPLTVICNKSDGFLSNREYRRMVSTPNVKGVNNTNEDTYAELETKAKVGTYPVVAALCSRQFKRPNMLYLPLDDDVFRLGLDAVINGHKPQPMWSERKSVAFWRGGSSGFDRPALRTRLVAALHGNAHADVKMTRGGWPENDSLVPNEFFGDWSSPEAHMQYKYIFIVDGACIASNHMWVFGTGSVPIMVTHPDNYYWFKQYLKPMENYVPVRYDLSDLHEKLQWLVEHDEEARAIAAAAKTLADEIFSPEFQRNYIDKELATIAGRKYNRIGFESVYTRKCQPPGDIHEHLPMLREYAGRCESIVECGGAINSATSHAFVSGLVGKPNSMYYLIDAHRSPHLDEFLDACEREGINATFFHGNNLIAPRVEADLVFIDTWHIYAQLKRELDYWHSYAKKYIILHDTTVDEWEGESIRGRFDIEKQSRETGWPVEEIAKGLWPAVEEFLEAHHEWELERRFVNCNGLTVLRRVA